METSAAVLGTRPDDPAGVMQHAGRYAGGTALIILGGMSSNGWQELKEEVKPDVILGGNGVNAVVQDLDVWACTENMNFTSRRAAMGEPRAMEFMEMFYREAGAKVKLISHRSWNLLKDTSRCISIRRWGWEADQVPEAFNYREYGEGFNSGWVFSDKRYMRLPQRVGNVGCQLIHMAAILGCDQVHTIGLDLMFKDKTRHHFYDYPKYMVDHFRNGPNFIDYLGAGTQAIWVQCAKFMKTTEPYLERDGIKWRDHSDGLLKLMGLRCTK